MIISNQQFINIGVLLGSMLFSFLDLVCGGLPLGSVDEVADVYFSPIPHSSGKFNPQLDSRGTGSNILCSHTKLVLPFRPSSSSINQSGMNRFPFISRSGPILLLIDGLDEG